MQYSLENLKKAFLDDKVVDEKVLSEIIAESGGDITLVAIQLIKDKLVTPQLINDYFLRLYGFKYVSLGKILITPNFLQMIPKEFSIEHEVIVFGENGHKLQVAMVNPGDLYALEYIRRRTGKELETYITDLASFQSVIKGYKSDIQNLFSKVLEDDKRGFGKTLDVKDIAEGVPITKAVNSILEYAIAEGASDIHIEPTEANVIIRFRMDGILNDMLVLLKSTHSLLVARIKIMADLKIDEHRRPQDGRISLRVNDLPISLRVSVLPTYHGEKIVIRILDESVKNLTLKDLGFSGSELKVIEEKIQRPDGMILVTGPTGSGKTTTLYTVMKILNRPDVNINTIEDPIEYSMPRINQTQVNPAIGVTFANGLRSLLRQDPDIIMVGEIRDEETANMAIHSSMTGHLVLSTLHTNDAPGAIPRFIDMGIEPFLLASTLQLVIAQRLVRKLCNDCKQKIKIDSISKKLIERQLEEIALPAEEKEKLASVSLHQPVGCARCGNSGYKGRIGIYEVFEITDKVRGLIIDRVPVHELAAEMIRQEHMPMFINGIRLVDDGVTTLEEVMRVAQE
ncbi:MAG: type II/IV secretion system protein [Candidatus Doudnabacteria bacterium]|nr:type II/IV secretion system protein [Candidatus Doudnabacteria bacterium]